ncbi:hypothetical protein GTP46_27075 [Duganella sp. FT135W]|uniref:Bacterial HORMA domain-containing protein n=1 Tax=Duganella flavida TaxID=2692175 RepID=A0A6L8KFT1_9BURK|nr:hypothetical protein [Duganella flavida]MYM26299.1 hypothetical protein [Duganella flavida]
MSTTYTSTSTSTYSVVDVENVVRRFSADIVMIASSSGALTEAKARDYAKDIETLAKNGYLSAVDVTLLKDGIELKAVRYDVSTDAGSLSSSRPGGVLWPREPSGWVRVTIWYTAAYDDAAREKMKGKLQIGWSASTADTSHSGLQQQGSRDYASGGFGMQRKDFTV